MSDFTRRKVRISRVIEVASSDHYTTWGGGPEGHQRSVYHTEVGLNEGDRQGGFDALMDETRKSGWTVDLLDGGQCDYGRALTELLQTLDACPQVEWVRKTGASNKYHALHEGTLREFLTKWGHLLEAKT